MSPQNSDGVDMLRYSNPQICPMGADVKQLRSAKATLQGMETIRTIKNGHIQMAA